MKKNKETALVALYNLILNPATRKWERSVLLDAKNHIEKGENLQRQLVALEAALRPLALRNNLTPDVTDFYLTLTSDKPADPFDFSKHILATTRYQERAIFGGGCFWCMVEPFETKPGIVSVLSGYTGGHFSHPTYEQVSGRYTGHVEAIEVIFDHRLVSYQELVALYWQLTDPTDAFGQFNDRGNNYRPVIFYTTPAQKEIAAASKEQLANSGKYLHPIVTAIEPAAEFWPAENYHQQFYKKNPERYKRINRARKQFLLFQKIQNKLLHPRNNHQKN